MKKLIRQIKGKYQSRLPQPRKEDQEFGPGKIDLLICQECGAVYYYKSWHHQIENYQKLSEDKPRTFRGLDASSRTFQRKVRDKGIRNSKSPRKVRGKRIKFILCPACQMIKDKKYEGLVSLKEVPQDKKEEILKLVRNVGDRAYQRDPMDRIIEIRDTDRDIEILTTENQLAVSLGKQIKRAFQGHLEIKWSHQESTVRVIIKGVP